MTLSTIALINSLVYQRPSAHQNWKSLFWSDTSNGGAAVVPDMAVTGAKMLKSVTAPLMVKSFIVKWLVVIFFRKFVT